MPLGGRVEPDGSYRIENLQAGEWRVRAELPGTDLYAEGEAQLEPGASEAHLDLEMKGGLELSGRVRRGGEPVAGAEEANGGTVRVTAKRTRSQWRRECLVIGVAMKCGRAAGTSDTQSSPVYPCVPSARFPAFPDFARYEAGSSNQSRWRSVSA